MKKNLMMRIASFLLVAVLISTSAISGTYAKYVTADDATDSARVAKWGVVASVDGTLFYDSYKDSKTTWTAGEDTIDITVQAATAGQRVVAPGTKNTEGMTIILSGAPEVDVDVVFKFEADEEIMLEKGTYTDYTRPSDANADGTPIYGNTFDLADNYYPVVFTLTKDGAVVAQGNVAAIQAYLAPLNTRYDTNEGMGAINGEYVLTWEWAFDAANNPNGLPTNDKADTYLGNAAVGAPFSTDGATTEMDVTFTITVTQVN